MPSGGRRLALDVHGRLRAMIGAGLAYQWNFYALAVPGVIGAVLVGLVPRAPGDAAPVEHPSAEGTARSLPEPT